MEPKPLDDVSMHIDESQPGFNPSNRSNEDNVSVDVVDMMVS